MKGTVKSFSPKDGYGFITADGNDYFIHSKNWPYQAPPFIGLEVEFVPKRTDKGYRATNVKKKGEVHGSN